MTKSNSLGKGLSMNLENIPDALRHLIPLVNAWGIEDDGFRDNRIYNASDEELKSLVRAVTDSDTNHLNAWLSNSQATASANHEYLKFSAFFLAFEYAETLLNHRLGGNRVPV